MSIALAVWSVAVAPGEKESVTTPTGLEIRITNVALGASLDDEHGRTTVKFSYNPTPKPEDLDSDAGSDVGEKVTTVLCSLTPGKIEQAMVDLILDSDEEFIFEVVGKNTVYLTGNYIQQGSGSDSDSDSENEEGFRLEDVSSDVEVDPAELDELHNDSGRFEELENDNEGKKEAAPKGKKRPADGMDVDDEAPPADKKLTKAQKKALKKQKGENGQAVPVASPEAKADGKKKEKKEKKKEDDSAAGATELKELSGGVQYRDVKAGDGASAKRGTTVKMRYIGKLTDGTIFDKNTNGKPFTFCLGTGEVIKGWDIGVAGMKVGGERELIIPPEMGYGKRKSGPIPPNSTLRFEVKLLALS